MSDTNGIQSELAASLSAAQAAASDPKLMNLWMTFKGMIDRGEISSISISAVRHDGLPALGFMGPETVPAKMLLHSAVMLLASTIDGQIKQQASMTNRPSPILRAGRPPGM